MRTEPECWMELPAPHKLFCSMCDSLEGGNTVWLDGEPSWPEEFRDRVREEFAKLDSGLNLEFIDAQSLSPETTPAKLVFSYNQAAKREYLPAMNLIDFIQKKDILSSTILWIYHVDKTDDSKWIAFSRELAKKSAPLRVICEGSLAKGPAKKVRVLSETELLSEFDYLLYAMMMVQERSWTSELKLYACRLAVAMADHHAEIIPELLSYRNDFILDPLKYGRQLVPQRTDPDLLQMIRTAQLVSLLPKIELLRARLIDNIKQNIDVSFPIKDDFGNLIEIVEELELRHILYYTQCGKINMTDDQYHLLNQLYEARNSLAHRKYLDGAEAYHILST